MTRLRRRPGVLVAALGVAISALLVVPVTVAPAHADHIDTWDNENWNFTKRGTWWLATSENCFTTYWEDLDAVSITNNGSQDHYFKWEWTDYSNHLVHREPLTLVRAGATKRWDGPSGGWGALHQVDHPRVKIYWENNANEVVLLWDLHPWSDSAYSSAAFQGSSVPRGC